MRQACVTLQLKKESCWLQVMSHMSPRYGGIARSVPRLARATEDAGHHSCPIAGFCDGDELEHLPKISGWKCRFFRQSIPLDHGYCLRRTLKNTIRASTGVHIHGIWETHCMMAAGIARDCNRPYMISVHGMLEPWALRCKRLKKALYAALFEIRRMKRAACLRALSLDEVNDYRRVGLTSQLPSSRMERTRNRARPLASFECVSTAHGQTNRFVLGAPASQEGTAPSDSGLGAPFDQSKRCPSGDRRPGFRGYRLPWKRRRRAQASVLRYICRYVNGEDKWSALAASSVFVLPSYSEGFSVAVLEALSMAVPVMVTTLVTSLRWQFTVAAGLFLPPAPA